MNKETDSKFEFVDSIWQIIPATRHVNPDGSLGGWVAENANVAPNSIIEPGALVEPRATVHPNQHVRRGERIPEPNYQRL